MGTDRCGGPKIEISRLAFANLGRPAPSLTGRLRRRVVKLTKTRLNRPPDLLILSIMQTKKELLTDPIQHIDIKQLNVVPLVDAMRHMAYSSRDLARAAAIYERMLRDRECGIILCLAGSLDQRRIETDLCRPDP